MTKSYFLYHTMYMYTVQYIHIYVYTNNFIENSTYLKTLNVKIPKVMVTETHYGGFVVVWNK